MLSKREFAKLPARKAYRQMARAVFDKELSHGSGSLSLQERNLGLAATLHEEVRNGGLTQYFTNPSGKDYELAINALRTIGATQQKSFVKKWLDHLPSTVAPHEPSEVGRCVFGNLKLRKKLDAIDNQYFDSTDSFYDSVVSYVLKNASAFGLG